MVISLNKIKRKRNEKALKFCRETFITGEAVVQFFSRHKVNVSMEENIKVVVQNSRVKLVS